MITAWALFFGCILCLMFLGMIYGEKLSIVSLFDGQWLAPFPRAPFPRTLGQLWNQLCLALDLLILFLMTHFSWVVATVSGSVGLFIIAFLMFSGMADDAAARHRDLHLPLHAGSVLDQEAKLRPKSSASVSLVSTIVDESEIVWQQPGGAYLVFKRPELDRSLVINRRRPDALDLIDFDLPAEQTSLDRPLLEISFLRTDVRSMHFEDESKSIARGRLEVTSPLPQLIERAMRRLRPDDWKMTYSIRDPGRNGPGRIPGRRWPGDLTETLTESTLQQVRELESRVRIVPGDGISSNELRVEKLFPRESSGAEVSVEISILNLADTTVNGLLVREFLPRGTRVRRTEPKATFRDDTLTWLVDELRPFDERVLRFTVLASTVTGGTGGARQPRFESATEVSAVTSVTSRTLVRDELPLRRPGFPADTDLLPPLDRLPALDFAPPNDRLPFDVVPRPDLAPRTEERDYAPGPFAGRPDVRLRIEEPVAPVAVGTAVEVNFVVENRGNAPAEGVGLRVILDQGLRHHTFAENEARREIVNGIRRLEPGERRTIVLRMKAARAGEFLSRAEMIYEGTALSQATFRVAAEQ